MFERFSSHPVRGARSIARILSAVVALLGASVLLGRAGVLSDLASIVPGAVGMNLNSAVGFCLAGIGVWLSLARGATRFFGQSLLAAAAVLAFAHLAREFAGATLPVGALAFRDEFEAASGTAGGRASTVTALCFLLVSSGHLLSLAKRATLASIGQCLVVVVALLAVHALFGYAYGVDSVYRLPPATTMALNSAIAFVLLAGACFHASAERGIGSVLTDPGPGGTLLRRMLPVLLVTPLLLGWIAVRGMSAGRFDLGFALALISSGSAALMLGFLAWTVHSVRSSDDKLLSAVRELAASERMFRVSFENAFVGMAHLDRSRRWLRVNARLAALLGYTEDALRDRRLDELVHPAHFAELDERLTEIERGHADVYTGEARWIARDGRLLWFDAHASARRSEDGTFQHFILVVQDVTEAKRAAEQLHIQARSLEAAATGISICDMREADDPIVYVNSAFERLTGYSRDEVIGRNCRFLSALAPDQAELEEVRAALRAGRACTVVLRNFTKEGVLFWNELSLSPVLDERGLVTHYIGIQKDITESRRLAADIDTSLRSALEERARALEATRARDVLLAIVSHELRSPLNSIRLWTSVLQADESANPATVQKALLQIESSVETQSRLIADLLDVSRIASGRMALEREELDLRTVVDEVNAEFGPAAERRGVQFTTTALASDVAIDGDRVRLKQVVRNLLENALKFTPRGGHIELQIATLAGEVELCIRDDGAGIDPDDLAHVFDQFWQAASDSSRRKGGLGLGLSIVKLIVERHGGRVRAESAGVGHGSTFFVTLPTVPSSSTTAARSAPLADVVTPLAADVLVVDDEAGTAEALALALQMRGLQVRVAHDGPGALRAIAALRPRVLISDLMMPGMNGFELLRRVRELERDGSTPRIHAIAISGRVDPVDLWRSRRAGFDAYMPKPIRVQAVVNWIRESLSQPERTTAERVRVLVVAEPESWIDALRGAGHEVHVAKDAAEAQALAARARPQLLVIDLEHVRGDALALSRTLREDQLSLFVVALTNRSARELDPAVFDAVLSKPVELEAVERILKQARTA